MSTTPPFEVSISIATGMVIVAGLLVEIVARIIRRRRGG